jgi:hypothetical protein
MNSENKNKKRSLIFILIIIGIFGLFIVSAADPEGPDSINIYSNTTKPSVSPGIVNISGGYIAKMNITPTVQDIRWKAFVGGVTGMFTLQDNSGAKIYDWTLNSITGKVYTTRSSSAVTWADINCSNITNLEQENYLMNHTNPNDNISITFNTTAGATHGSFFVGSIEIVNNSCPTLNTYKDNSTQDTLFEEMALFDGTNIVYATIINQNQAGFNSKPYDFQMIVPENGAASFRGATAYYLYVEI